MSDLGAPLDRRDLELLRADDPPDPRVRARVRAKLAAVFPFVAASPGAEARQQSRAAGGHRTAPQLLHPRDVPGSGHAITFLAFLIGGVTGAALYAGLAKPPRQVVYVERPPVAPLPTPRSALPSAAISAAVAPATSFAVPSVPLSEVSSRRDRPSQLSAERVVLDGARAALVQGHTSRALALVERHRLSFANPLLAEERDALEIQALIKAGSFEEARARADAFHKRNPDSLFSAMITAAIESIP